MFKFAKFAVAAAVLGAVVGVPGVARADCSSSSFVCSGPIEALYASPDDNLIYIDPQGSTSPLVTGADGNACVSPASKYIILQLGSDVSRATYQLLLGAFLAGKSVDIRVSTSNTCKVRYVVATP